MTGVQTCALPIFGSLAWQHFGWTGLCALGLALFATALVVQARSNTSTVIQSALTRRT